VDGVRELKNREPLNGVNQDLLLHSTLFQGKAFKLIWKEISEGGFLKKSEKIGIILTAL
jgi:hypothetical protein